MELKSKEELIQLIKNHENIVHTVKTERDLAIQKCLDQSIDIQTLSQRIYWVEDKWRHRELFAQQAMKNLKLVSKERDVLAERIKQFESEENKFLKNVGNENNQRKKSKIPRSNKCHLSERKLDNTFSRYQILPPLIPNKKLMPPTSFFVSMNSSTDAIKKPTPPSLPPPVKRRTTSFFVPFVHEQPVKIGLNGDLNPFKILPPVLKRSQFPNACVRRQNSAKKVQFDLPDVDYMSRRRE